MRSGFVRIGLTCLLVFLAPQRSLAEGTQSDIVGGTETTDFPAVAALLNENGQFFCSAFLIGPSCLLTAAHCVLPNLAPGSSAFFGSVIGEEHLAWINIRESVPHPSWDGVFAAHDVAVVALWSATDIVPLARNTPGSNPINYTIVGFGDDAGNVDGIKRTATVPQQSTSSTEIATTGTSSNVCSGDSGSPLLRDIGGELQAIGVASMGDVSCNQFAIWARLSADSLFIDAAAAEICTAIEVGNAIFLDGFESESTGAWSATEPP